MEVRCCFGPVDWAKVMKWAKKMSNPAVGTQWRPGDSLREGKKPGQTVVVHHTDNVAIRSKDF